MFLSLLKIHAGRLGMRFKEYRRITVTLSNGQRVEVSPPSTCLLHQVYRVFSGMLVSFARSGTLRLCGGNILAMTLDLSSSEYVFMVCRSFLVMPPCVSLSKMGDIYPDTGGCRVKNDLGL
jgi:hypothetical protein